jgi:hypothetical protein
MKKYIVFLLLICNVGCTKKKNQKNLKNHNFIEQHFENKIDNRDQIKSLVEAVYGKNSVNLSLDQIFMIEDLISSIINLSEEDLRFVAAQVVSLLQEQLVLSSPIQKLVYTYQIDYLNKISNHAENIAHENHAIFALAKQVVEYIHIEEENILQNEKNKHLFITTLQSHNLPPLINFWSSPMGEKIIAHYDAHDAVKIEFIKDMIIDLSIMMATQQGASMANQKISMQAQLLAATISKDSQTIQTDMQAFQTKSQANQQKNLEAMITAFSNAQKNIQAQTAQAAAISNLELDYLYKNMSVDKPQQNYIFNQIQFDQLFTLGTMLTPQGSLWKNPFSVGDWEYESSSNSFWQYQSSPIYNTVTDDSGSSTKSALQAENNSIFTEYYTNSKSYTVAASIALHRVDYPFFAGIIFNKSRWISGDFEAIRKCRMIGIYGASSNDVGIYFAQQYTMTDEQMKAAGSSDPIQTPLQQIITNKVNKRINLPATIFSQLQSLPVILHFEITNSPTTIKLKFWIDNEQPISTVINNLDPSIFMYHGIGFICPGAVAEFKITEPSQIVFTPQAILNYKD